MRIISGKYKGRKVEGYLIDGTRPTMDRVKESVMGIIQNRVDDSICLDLFAGSGSIGLELLSNGARKCFFVDNNKIVIDTLKKNSASLKIEEETEFINNDFKRALFDFNNRGIKFDIIYLDPPYKMEFIKPAIDLIIDYKLLNDNGIIICEYENEKFDYDELNLIKERRYGSKNIKIYKKVS